MRFWWKQALKSKEKDTIFYAFFDKKNRKNYVKFNKNVRSFIKEITIINKVFPNINIVKEFYFLNSEMDKAPGLLVLVVPILSPTIDIVQALLDYQTISSFVLDVARTS